MPYITQDKRDGLDPKIDELLDVLRGYQCDDPDNDNLEGNLNYVISSILNRLYSNGYADINSAMGLLGSVQAEYYRKQAAPYEDQREFETDSVYTKGRAL